MADMFDWLRRSDPASRPEPDPPSRDDRDRLLAEVVTSPYPEHRPRRLRRWHRIGLVAAAAVAATAAGWVLFRPVAHPTMVACYQSTDVEGVRQVEPVDPAAGFIGTCRALWDDRAEGFDHEIPGLTECVLDSGTMGVFPATGAGVCTRLGLAEPEPESSQTGRRLAAVQQRLTEQLDGSCLSASATAALAEYELASEDLTSWKVETKGVFSSARPCGSVSIDPDTSTIWIVPVRDRG